MSVFVIGLFRSLQRKFDAECGRAGLQNAKVLADIGAKGTLTLLPFANDAIHALRAYLDKLDDYCDAHIIVLPYAPIPEELEDELTALVDCGATVIRGAAGQDGWPLVSKRPDTPAINAVYHRVWQAMPGAVAPDEVPPSDYFRQIIDANPRFLLADGVLASCDLVAPHRYEFLKRSADALVEFAIDGSGGRIDAFFRERALDHAQSGGIDTTLEVYDSGELVYSATMNTHLKQGDRTTPEGAARLYYHTFSHMSKTYVAVLYAGPHPDRNVRWVCQLS